MLFATIPAKESSIRYSTYIDIPSLKKRDASTTTSTLVRPLAKSGSTKRKKAPIKKAKISKKAKTSS